MKKTLEGVKKVLTFVIHKDLRQNISIKDHSEVSLNYNNFQDDS
jgi:hypothetical protein